MTFNKKMVKINMNEFFFIQIKAEEWLYGNKLYGYCNCSSLLDRNASYWMVFVYKDIK